MSNAKVIPFEFQSAQVRTMVINDQPWFCAADVCAVLGYANNRDALAKHCREKGVAKRDTPTAGGAQSLTFIDEGNLYRLIIKSRKPQALAFESWVCDEVLPAIRRSGRYDPGAVRAEREHLRECASWSVLIAANTQLAVFKTLAATSPAGLVAERFLLGFDDAMRPSVTAIAQGALVLTLDQFARSLACPNDIAATDNQLLAVAKAVVTRLADGWAGPPAR